MHARGARRLFLLAALLSSSALLQTRASAQRDAADLATARQLGREAEDALEARDYASASEKFQRADDLYGGGKDVHAPTLLLGLARSQMGLGKYVAAQETYNRILRDGVVSGAPTSFVDAVASARAEVDGPTPHIGNVVIQVTGAPDAKVLLDDATPVSSASWGVRRIIDAGKHTLSASAPGHATAREEFEIKDGSKEPVTVVLRLGLATKDTTDVGAAVPPSSVLPPSNPQDGWRKPALFGALGLGVVGVAVGTVFGVITKSRHDDAQAACTLGPQGNGCDAQAVSKEDDARTSGTLSTVAFAVGGVGVAGAVVLWLTAPRASAAPSTAARLTITPDAGSGRFGVVINGPLF